MKLKLTKKIFLGCALLGATSVIASTAILTTSCGGGDKEKNITTYLDIDSPNVNLGTTAALQNTGAKIGDMRAANIGGMATVDIPGIATKLWIDTKPGQGVSLNREVWIHGILISTPIATGSYLTVSEFDVWDINTPIPQDTVKIFLNINIG